MGVIEVEGITTEYGNDVGIDSLSFSVDSGEAFGLLGPQGAGKTTTIRTILGFQSPRTGTTRVLGCDVHSERGRREVTDEIGYVPATPGYDDRASIGQILDAHEAVHGGDRRDVLIERFGLEEDRRIHALGPREQRLLALVVAFMHDPSVAILDEPTTGVDPVTRQRIVGFIDEERRRGTTVLLSSRSVDSMVRLCDRIAVLWSGRRIRTETPASLPFTTAKQVSITVERETDMTAFDRLQIENFVSHDTEVPPPAGSGPETPPVAATTCSFLYTGPPARLLESIAPLECLTYRIEPAPVAETLLATYEDLPPE
ncbi:ABC transporter ATP-binding protein [Halocatena halophila]|uniref:ABC transporter ATP-binding protein n=1 Tax=Halocatena halophila TaxID=2814576 RepID=UPI002ED591F4